MSPTLAAIYERRVRPRGELPQHVLNVYEYAESLLKELQRAETDEETEEDDLVSLQRRVSEAWTAFHDALSRENALRYGYSDTDINSFLQTRCVTDASRRRAQ